MFSFSLEMLESCFTVFFENKEESRYHFKKLYRNRSVVVVVVVVKLQEDRGRPLPYSVKYVHASITYACSM